MTFCQSTLSSKFLTKSHMVLMMNADNDDANDDNADNDADDVAASDDNNDGY